MMALRGIRPTQVSSFGMCVKRRVRKLRVTCAATGSCCDDILESRASRYAYDVLFAGRYRFGGIQDEHVQLATAQDIWFSFVGQFEIT